MSGRGADPGDMADPYGSDGDLYDPIHGGRIGDIASGRSDMRWIAMIDGMAMPDYVVDQMHEHYLGGHRQRSRPKSDDDDKAAAALLLLL